MSHSIRNMTQRFARSLLWLSLTEEEQLEETRRKSLAVFHQQWTEQSDLADIRLADFLERFQDYNIQLEKVRKLDSAHEAKAQEGYRTNPEPGLNYYLEEARPHLTAQEMVLVDSYRRANRAIDELNDALDSLFSLKLSLYYSPVLQRDSIIELYRRRESQYYELRHRASAVQARFLKLSYQDSRTEPDASIVSKWRAKQNRRRHALS